MAHDQHADFAFPSNEQILDFIENSPTPVGKRELARAFSLKGAQRARLGEVLKELRAAGALVKAHKNFDKPGRLPPVTVLDVLGPDVDGELRARPHDWDQPGAPPQIYLRRGRRTAGPAPDKGDRVLAKLTYVGPNTYEARVMRLLTAGTKRLLGIYQPGPRDARVVPTDRKHNGEIVVETAGIDGVAPGALVTVELLRGRQFGLRRGKIAEVIGNINEPKSISLISIHARGIPMDFDPAAAEQARRARPAPLGGRTDLRDVALVTIDGADARDFDDAVWAEPDTDPENPGGWHLMVAIADVSWYVRPDDPLDRNARERGNSVYFPDRVVPMLPVELSNGLCSLVPGEDRPCLAVEMWITARGRKIRHRFCRAMMRSAARLTYEQVQQARDGAPDEITAPLLPSVITPLYGAYRSLLTARRRRGVLELDLPERKISVDTAGKVCAIAPRARHDSHKLIEEFMILANVCAAEELERRGQPCMYRIHDAPADDKLENLREFLDGLGYPLAKGQVLKPRAFNQILERAKDTPESELVSTVVLRSQSQAEYNPENIGHFGLSLPKYAHFTSPIRRYADLLVHRALVAGLGLGPGGLPDRAGDDFPALGEAISNTERRAAAAERDAVDRYVAAYMMDKVGATFTGRVSGVTRFGLFVKLTDLGADGLVPISTLPDDHYVHDSANHSLVGRHRRRVYRLGDEVTVRIVEANLATGSLVMDLRAGGRKGAAKGHTGHVRAGPKERPRRGGRRRLSRASSG